MSLQDNYEAENESSSDIPNDSTIAESTKDTYTLLIYICGSDLESRYGAASKNIAEMQEATFGEGINVLVQTGGTKAWKDTSISAQSTDRYLIKSGEKQLIDRDTVKQNFGESQTLSDFIKFGVEQYPAEQYGLILWDHGAGSMKGVCFDANFGNDALTLPEIKDALASANDIIGKNFEFVGFDACLMATYDVACILEPYANYMIASEELEPSSGWDYKTLISSLGQDTFYTDVLNSYAEKQSAKATYTLSAIDLSEMDRANELIGMITDQIYYDVSYVSKALSKGKEFGANNGVTSSNLFDLGLILESLGLKYSFDGFISNVNGTVHEDATGMSLYFPTEQEELIEEYRSICQNDNYMQFLVDYFNYQPETPIEFENSGYDNNGCLSFTLKEASKKYVQSVGYQLYSFEGNKENKLLYSLGTDNDIICENDAYTVNFHGNWFFINDMPLHINIYDEKQDYTIFSASVKINGEICQLLFTYFKSTNSYHVEGYVVESDITSRIHNFVDGTEITIIYENHISEGNQLYYEEGSFVWGEDVNFSINKVEVGYYQYIPYIIDIYGNVYYGKTAIVYSDGEKSIIDCIAAG